MVGEEYSKCIDVTSGVPQGSLLGPILFLLYINDCLNGLSCDAVIFADDVKMWRTIESPSDVQSLQNDVDYLSSWSQGGLMSFNTDKCVVLRLHPRQARENNVHYQLNGEHPKNRKHSLNKLYYTRRVKRAIQRRREAWTTWKNSSNATSAAAYLHLQQE